MSSPRNDLNQMLPYEGKWRWGYQHYPVFGWAWWRGRALVFGLGVMMFTIMTGIGMLIDFDNKNVVVTTTIIFFIGVGGMALSGATLMTLVRTIVEDGQKQKVMISVAFLVGLGLTMVFDAWSSGEIERAFAEHSSQKELMAEASKASLDNGQLAMINGIAAFLLYFWLSAGIAFIRYWREPSQLRVYLAQQELSEARSERHRAEAKLSMLQAQIEPHFLFNSLASVKSVIRDKPELAEKTIDNLVDYLRASIPRFDDDNRVQTVTLGQQIELCAKYLEVMKLRLGDRLNYSIDFADEIAEHVFPPLVITSLVENAIKHGIEPSVSGGSVSISAAVEGRDLLVKVIDTGVGLNHHSHGSSSGLGLANIKEQLAVLYGAAAKLELSADDNGVVTASINIRGFLK